jgi:hypothetical protein
MPQDDINEMSIKIKNLLSEENILKEEVKDEVTHFHFICEKPLKSGVVFDIFQPINRNDLIAITMSVLLPAEQLKQLNAIVEKEREDFIGKITFGLLFQKPSFKMLSEGNTPICFRLKREIYYDGFNKNKLMDSIEEIRRGFLFIKLKFKERFRGNTHKTERDPMFG